MNMGGGGGGGGGGLVFGMQVFKFFPFIIVILAIVHLMALHEVRRFS